MLTLNPEFKGEIIPAYYVQAEEEAREILAQYQDPEQLFGIDTETMAMPEYAHNPDAALSPHLSKIRLVQIYDGEISYIFDHLALCAYERYFPDYFHTFLTTHRFVAHFANFDYGFFISHGIAKMNIACTYMISKLVYHATYPLDIPMGHSLKALCETLLEEDITKAVQASDWSIPNLTFEQLQYSALDPYICYKIAERLAPYINKYEMQRIYELTKKALHPIVKMQLYGIGFDTEKHEEALQFWKKECIEAKKEVREKTGIEKITAHSIASWLEENLDEKTKNFWPETETGKLSTDAHTLADFSYVPIVKPFSRFQKQEKLINAFGIKFRNTANECTHRIHSKFDLTGTRTGRISCSSPNMQQLPRSPKEEEKERGVPDIRNLFLARPGYVFLCADYSQIELRVAAELSGDEAMLNAYRDGIDLHRLTASVVSGKPLSDVTKEDRQFAKALNFGLLFGLGATKFSHYARFSYGVEVEHSDAVAAVEKFRETYSGYYAWQMEQATNCRETCYVRTPSGKLRKLPSDNTYGTSMNTPVQGGAAECMFNALIFLQSQIDACNEDMHITNCVHDEILVECREDRAWLAKEWIPMYMTQGFQAVFPKGITRNLVEVKMGRTWAEAK